MARRQSTRKQRLNRIHGETVKNKLHIYFIGLFILLGTDPSNSLAQKQIATESTIRLEFRCPTFTDRQLRDFAGITRAKYPSDQLSLIIDNILKVLAGEGYPFATIDSMAIQRDRDGESLVLFMDVGKPLILHESEITGWQDDDKMVIKGSQLTERFILARTMELLEDITDKGYPFAQVTVIPQNMRERDDLLETDLIFRVDPGRFARLRKIGFPGARLTKERILRLESRLNNKDTFDRSNLKRARERLERLKYVSRVDEPRLIESGAGWIDLEIPVQERRVNTFPIRRAPGSSESIPDNRARRTARRAKDRKIPACRRATDRVVEGSCPLREGHSDPPEG